MPAPIELASVDVAFVAIGMEIESDNIPIVLPELGANGESLRVGCWLVEIGEFVAEGDRIVEVLMRGISFDVAAPSAGKIVRMEKQLDDPLESGDILGWIRVTSE